MLITYEFPLIQMLFTQCCDFCHIQNIDLTLISNFFLNAFSECKVSVFFQNEQEKIFHKLCCLYHATLFTFVQQSNVTLRYGAVYVAYLQMYLFSGGYNPQHYYVIFTPIVFFLPYIREKTRQIRERTFENQIFRSNFALRNQRQF